MTESLNVSCSEIQDQFQALKDRAYRLVAGLDDEQMAWAPSEKSWSIAQCLDHLCIVGEVYLGTIEASIAQAREKGWRGDGVSRPGWFERWFIGSLEPPPKRRFKAPGAMAPTHHTPGSELVVRFKKLQERLQAVTESAADLDVNAATIRSPFARILKLRVGAALQVNTAHGRRHLWQAEKVRNAEGFPGDPLPGGSS